MEILIAIGVAQLLATLGVGVAVFKRTAPPSPTAVDPETPAWGTQARKQYHVRQRDYHTQMVIEAGRAAREGR